MPDTDADVFTLYELASYLQQDLDTATADQARTTAINYLRRELGVEFDQAPRTLAERVPPTTLYRQLLGPLVSVESVTIDGADSPPGNWDRTNRGVLLPAGLAPHADTWVDLEIAYTAGFDTIPSDIKDAALHLAGLAYLRGTRPGVTGSTISVEGVSETQTYATGSADSQGAAVALDEATLRSLRAAYGSGRQLVGSARLR
jgi:hypothetical protein